MLEHLVSKIFGTDVPVHTIWTEIWGWPTTFDLFLSYYFVGVYFVCYGLNTKRVSQSALLVAAMIVFGHIVTVVFLIWRIITEGSLRDAIFPLRGYADPEHGKEKRKNPVTRVIAAVAVVAATYFIAICAIALGKQSLGDAGIVVKNNPYLFVIFMNNLVGILFSIVYIAVSEMARWYVVPMACVCIIFGNTGAMIYLVLKMLNDVGSTPTEAMLTPNVPSS